MMIVPIGMAVASYRSQTLLRRPHPSVGHGYVGACGMERMKHAGLNGLLAVAAITLAGCVPPGANTSATMAALEHCSDFHYPQPPGVELPMKFSTNAVAYDQFGPRVWSNTTGAHRVECTCVQNMNFANSSKEFLREIVNKAWAEPLGFRFSAGDVFLAIGNEAQYEFQGTSTKPEYHGNSYFGRMIGAGSCLFIASSGILPNSNDEYLKSEWVWLRSVNYGRQSNPIPNSTSEQNISDRLKTLDELRDQHRISDDEYLVQRARILGGI
jgi:hypothetical protein